MSGAAGERADPRAVVERFAIEGELVDVRALERGHIHDTFVSEWRLGTSSRRYVHQRMNEAVFPDLDLLMANIERVTEHLRARAERAPAAEAGGLVPLRLVATRDGASYLRASDGAWRTFEFVENTVSYDRCTSARQAHDAARAFGWFQAELADLPADALGETLPDFFSSPARYRQFEAALEAADDGRRAAAREEIDFARARADQVARIDELLRAGTLPRRVVHGDTKLNNVLFDADTGAPRAIVDLDTCMPGYSLYDFGDLVRFTAATSAEDERDVARAGTDLTLYRALAAGYLSTAGAFLSAEERELMPFAARLVTLTIGLRFLADHLAGDVYFKVARAGHNLDRARVQFAMVRYMERHEAEMRAAGTVG